MKVYGFHETRVYWGMSTDFANEILVRNWMHDMSKEFADILISMKQERSSNCVTRNTF